MTVPTTSIVAGPYTGNGVTTTFDYNWTIWQASELILYQTDTAGNVTTLTEGTDYTVNGVGSTTGRTVTLTNPLPTGYTLLIKSDFVPTQETDFVSQGAFYPQVHEDALDKLTYLVQQLVEADSRSLSLSPTTTGVDPTLPTPIPGYLLGWDSPATKLTNVAPGSTVINVGATAPDPAVFPLWYDTNVSGLKYHDGAAWVSVDASGKADKLAGATAGAVPTLDASGNIAGELIPGAANGVATLDANATLPVSQLPARIDLSTLTADVTLQVGQEAFLQAQLVGMTSVPLHIAVADDQIYELSVSVWQKTMSAAQSLYLLPNNTSYASAFWWHYFESWTSFSASGSQTLGSFIIVPNCLHLGSCHGMLQTRKTGTTGYNFPVFNGVSHGSSADYDISALTHTYWTDNTTPYTSMGSLQSSLANTNTDVFIRVKRVA